MQRKVDGEKVGWVWKGREWQIGRDTCRSLQILLHRCHSRSDLEIMEMEVQENWDWNGSREEARKRILQGFSAATPMHRTSL
jgi:hypothetical protein